MALYGLLQSTGRWLLITSLADEARLFSPFNPSTSEPDEGGAERSPAGLRAGDPGEEWIAFVRIARLLGEEETGKRKLTFQVFCATLAFPCRSSVNFAGTPRVRSSAWGVTTPNFADGKGRYDNCTRST